MKQTVLSILIGCLAGVFSGLLGIGGGIIVIPALIFAFGLSQHQAQGTTLAMLVLPIGLLAAMTYYKMGHVNLKIAGWLAAGFFFGGLGGAHLAAAIPEPMLRKLFGAVMLIVSLKLIFL